jgi:hypothetical protein
MASMWWSFNIKHWKGNILDDYVFAMPPTFQTIYEIFLRIRSEIPRYDQGNCVVLTQRILNAIDPKFYATENEEADLYGF